MGRLTTHVLDTALGRPARGVPVDLYRVTGDARELLVEAVTNGDGRCDAPLLEGEAFRVGEYELVFRAAGHLARTAVPDGDPGGDPGGDPDGDDDGPGGAARPAFLATIPIRFGIGNADEHYHVPLLLSPYGYSTYRGS